MSRGSGKNLQYACSKCFTKHPFEELSTGQQLCKKCRGDFPIVKCTYCRSEFQQENRNKTSSICKRCEQCVAQYGKPSTCQYCQLPAAFVGGKCQRCSHYYKRYGPPKICEQCKQKSAFDKGDNSKLMCWVCSYSYKRALAKTKQSDPARHSRVFKKEKKALSEEDILKKRERYMNSKKPNRPDVTKIETEHTSNTNSSNKSNHDFKAVQAKKEPRPDGDTDHVGEITQLKEKIAFLEKTIKQKENQLISKDKEITQMKAKVFNEEKLIREKMKHQSLHYDNKVTELSNKIRALQNEISKLKKDSRLPMKKAKQDNLFKESKKRTISRTNSPIQPRSRSRSPQTKVDANPDDPSEVKRSRSRSPAANSSAANSVRSSPSRSPSPAAKVARIEDSPSPVNNPTVNGEENAGGAANNDGDKEEEKEIAESVTGNGEVEEKDVEMTEKAASENGEGDNNTENMRNSRSPSPSPSVNGEVEGEGVQRGSEDGPDSTGEGEEEGEVHEGSDDD